MGVEYAANSVHVSWVEHTQWLALIVLQLPELCGAEEVRLSRKLEWDFHCLPGAVIGHLEVGRLFCVLLWSEG
jgi:hypothetical protein